MKGNAYGKDAPSLLWDTRHEYTRKRVELYYLVCSLSVPQYSDFAYLQLVDYVNCNIAALWVVACQQCHPYLCTNCGVLYVLPSFFNSW